MDGGKHIVSASPTKLKDSNKAYRILTIRLEPGDATRVDFSNEDNAASLESHGYLVATTTSGESWTFGPFDAGCGVKPSEIYIWGSVGEILRWNGFES